VVWASGDLFDGFPVVLGHESAGIVEAVGPAVTRVAPGDRVGLALAHHCGHCSYCESGRPMLFAQRAEDVPRMLRDGVPLLQGFGTGGFSEGTVVREASVIKLPDDVPLDVAAVVGCATSTGLGAVFNIAEVEYGSTVAVLGAGGVGLNVVMGCVIAGAARIVVADPNVGRREQALTFGATDACDASDAALLGLEPGGFDYVFECAGLPESMSLGVRITARGGSVVMIGAPRPDAELRINALEFVPSQRKILGCLTGNVRPNVDFPRYFRLYSRGLLPLDRLITAHVPFDDITKAFAMNANAEGIRTVVSITDE
jgi:S-(hydroxymethyl)glutathione dehydrogenase/alcohol dehydrogenase